MRTLPPKTINNCLTVPRMLVIAYKRGLIDKAPEVEWLKTAKPEFDFLEFDEAERLVHGTDGESRAMILARIARSRSVTK